MNKKHTFLALFLNVICVIGLSAQEALLSDTERYYDFLALQGAVERPYLNYRTLSDSAWKIDPDAEHPWQGQNLGITRKLFGDVAMRVYGPELFASFNTAAPYGQNDGALWQGKGLNSSFTTGIRFTGYGIEATFRPQIAFSQNLAFDYIPPNYSGDNYAGKGAVYGYYGVPSIDAPQRFGNEPFFVYDWGDSEIRYAWKTLTIGFGTQAIWLGPAQLNPIIHSNNAPTYPKLDIGLRKQRITLPRLNWYLGDIEFRAWWGYLSESDYFDNDSDNDHNLITGFAIAYGVPFLPGLSIGLNRIMLSKWNAMNYEAIAILLWPFMEKSAGSDNNDQRASIIFDYLLPIADINIYLEWGRNDFSSNTDLLIRYPFHTAGYTFGVKKFLNITKLLKGEILLELTDITSSRDYDLLWPTTFYAHHIITQGHTNQGQWLGTGIGTGGNSQYLEFKLYYQKGYGKLFLQRRNPDLDYTWYIDSNHVGTDYVAEGNIRASIDIGISNLYFITKNISLSGFIVFQNEYNPLNKSVPSTRASIHRYNMHFSFLIKFFL
jgi:hypothetical protein